MKDILIFAIVTTALVISLYRKYIKRKRDTGKSTDTSGGAMLKDQSGSEESYEPYGKK